LEAICAHYWTEDYIDLLVDLGQAGAVMARGLGAGGGAELEARLRLMERAGIEMQVLSACPQLPYGEDEQKAARAARFVNDQYAELVERRRDRFRATGTHSSARSNTSTTPRSTQAPPAPSSTRTPASCSASDRNGAPARCLPAPEHRR